VIEQDDRALLEARVKREIRRKMRALRTALPSAARAARNEKIVKNVIAHPWFESATGVATFWPIVEKGEVDLRALDEVARQRGKSIYYPFMEPTESGYRTGFRRVSSWSELADRGRGFLEPDPALAIAERGEIDLILVPGLAAGADGHRIGYGAGFYDATLPDHCPPAQSAVVVFEFQLIAEVPAAKHDVACDAVISDKGVLLRADAELGPSR
jgi:5-formyltetrahydrofolate cyclo-ligase